MGIQTFGKDQSNAELRGWMHSTRPEKVIEELMVEGDAKDLVVGDSGNINERCAV